MESNRENDLRRDIRNNLNGINEAITKHLKKNPKDQAQGDQIVAFIANYATSGVNVSEIMELPSFKPGTPAALRDVFSKILSAVLKMNDENLKKQIIPLCEDGYKLANQVALQLIDEHEQQLKRERQEREQEALRKKHQETANDNVKHNVDQSDFGKLPRELVEYVYTFLPPSDKRNVEQVAKFFYSIPNKEKVWEEQIKRDYPDIDPSDLEKIKQYTGAFKRAHEFISSPKSYWISINTNSIDNPVNATNDHGGINYGAYLSNYFSDMLVFKLKEDAEKKDLFTTIHSNDLPQSSKSYIIALDIPEEKVRELLSTQLATEEAHKSLLFHIISIQPFDINTHKCLDKPIYVEFKDGKLVERFPEEVQTFQPKR